MVVGFSDFLALVRFFRDRSPLFFDGSMFNKPGGFPLPVILEWNDARHLTSKGLIKSPISTYATSNIEGVIPVPIEHLDIGTFDLLERFSLRSIGWDGSSDHQVPSLENLDPVLQCIWITETGDQRIDDRARKVFRELLPGRPALNTIGISGSNSVSWFKAFGEQVPHQLKHVSVHNESNCESLAEFLRELLTQTQQLSSLSVADDFQLFAFDQGETSRMDVLQYIATWAIVFPGARSLRMGIEYPAEHLARCFCDSSNAELQHLAVKCMDDATPFLQNVTLPNLRFFELTAPQASIHSLEHFLQRHPYLEYLDISHCKLLGEFQGSISYHQIKFLFAEDCFACDWVKEGLVTRKFPRLRFLDISINILEATEAIRLELADIVALGIDGRCIDPDGLVLPPLEFLSINGLDAIRSSRSSPVLQAKAIWNRFPRAGTSTNFTKVVDARAIRALDCSFNPELTNLVGCLPDLGNTQLLVCNRSIDWNGALPSSLRCFLGGSDGFRNELVSRNIAALPCPDGLEQPGFPYLSMPRCLSFDDHQIVFGVR